MSRKRRSVDRQTFERAFGFCAKKDLRFGQFIINALTTMQAQSRNDFQGLLWNVENEDLEREINSLIDMYEAGTAGQAPEERGIPAEGRATASGRDSDAVLIESSKDRMMGELRNRLQASARERQKPFADENSRESLIQHAREQIIAAHGDSRPFAFTTCKVESTYSVRPDLVGAVQAARDRFTNPSLMISISAWFPDGSEYVIEHGFVSQFQEDGRLAGWITNEQAHELERKLFGEENG